MELLFCNIFYSIASAKVSPVRLIVHVHGVKRYAQLNLDIVAHASVSAVEARLREDDASTLRFVQNGDVRQIGILPLVSTPRQHGSLPAEARDPSKAGQYGVADVSHELQPNWAVHPRQESIEQEASGYEVNKDPRDKEIVVAAACF